MKNADGKFIFCATRGVAGCYVYYTGSVRVKELLDIARCQLKSVVSGYKFSDPSCRLVNSIVLGCFGGDPRWQDICVKDAEGKLPEDIGDTMGFIEFSGEEDLFVLDGRKRFNALLSAYNQDKSIGEEDIPVVLVAASPNKSKGPKGLRESTEKLKSMLA